MNKPKVKVSWCASYAEASIELSGLIAQRYPNDPDALDCLTIKTVPCRGPGVKGQVLAAWPTQEGATTDNVLMVYFGVEPPPAVS